MFFYKFYNVVTNIINLLVTNMDLVILSDFFLTANLYVPTNVILILQRQKSYCKILISAVKIKSKTKLKKKIIDNVSSFII